MTTRSPRARLKLLALMLFSLMMTGVLLEGGLMLLDRRFARYFRNPAFQPTLADAERFLASPRFNATLGWLSRAAADDVSTSKAPFAQAYGDSFVRSGHDSGKTWQLAFEEITGQPIVNYGEGGYGLDQAVLKFERYRDTQPARVAILGLYSEAFRRARTHYAYSYFRTAGWRWAFKPFFMPQEGSFILVLPPCVDARCLVDAVSGRNVELNRILAQHDYWYQRDRALPSSGFPRTWAYAQILPHVIAARRSPGVQPAFVDAVALDLVEYLVRRFAQGARAAGMVPVCLLLYSAPELVNLRRGVRDDEQLRRFLDHERIATVDSGQHILKALPSETTFARITVPDGHMNREGDRLIAEALAHGLKSLGLLQSGVARRGP
jgi:hypothetical protein